MALEVERGAAVIELADLRLMLFVAEDQQQVELGDGGLVAVAIAGQRVVVPAGLLHGELLGARSDELARRLRAIYDVLGLPVDRIGRADADEEELLVLYRRLKNEFPSQAHMLVNVVRNFARRAANDAGLPAVRVANL